MQNKKVKYNMFGKTKLVSLDTYTNGKQDNPAKSKWDETLWIERGEDWYALSSYGKKTVLIVRREDFLGAEEYKTPLDELL